MDVFSSQVSQESDFSESIMSNQEAPKEKNLTCNLCGHLSTSVKVLGTHKAEAHDSQRNRIKRLQCLWCPKSHQTRKGLKLHFSTCLGVKDLSFPRSCSVCGFKIETLKALQLHI